MDKPPLSFCSGVFYKEVININIDVSIKNRIASLPNDAEIVCGNADYVINFDFNGELSEAEEKTARYIFDGKVVDLKFTGNSCRAPIVSNSRELIIGVFTENYASTYIRVPCRFSTLCEDVAGMDAKPLLFPNYEKEIADLNNKTKWFEEIFLNSTVSSVFTGKSIKTLPLFDFSKVTNFKDYFSNCSLLESIPLIDTSNGTSFQQMFGSCKALKSVPLIDTSNGENFTYMFAYCSLLESVPDFNTANGETFDRMFYGCEALKATPKLNLYKAKSISYMYYNCKSIETAELNFENGVSNVSYLFNGCSSLKSVYITDVKNPITSNVTRTFYNCIALKTITGLNMSNVSSFSATFYNCEALETVGVEGSISRTVDFKYSTKLTVESAKNIIKALTNYAGTNKENSYTIYFASEVWERLDAEGNTAPHGGTWSEYALDVLKWNI